MITQHEKAKGFWWKLLATIPVLAVLLLVAVNCQTNDKTGMVNDKDTLEAEQYDHQVDNAMTQDELPMSGEDNVYDVVEVAPEFPGGMSEMANYLSSNITYPQEARDQGIQGRVFIGFVVEKDGSVTEVEVLRGIGELCDNEAVRVVRAMPKWQPGIQDGKPVRVRYNLPINFKLQ